MNIKWGNIFQYAIIGLAGFIAVKLAWANWLGLIGGALAGAYVTYKVLSSYYLRKFGASNAQAALQNGGYYDPGYQDPAYGNTGYPQALMPGQSGQDQYYAGQQYAEQYAEQTFQCEACGGQLYHNQQYPDFFTCQGCGSHYPVSSG